MRALEARIPPVVVFLAAAGIVHLGVRLMPAWTGAPSVWSRAVVGLLLLAGAILGSAGVAQFLQARTTVHPSHPDRASVLVTGGVYRVTRNPMYLGLACLLGAYGVHLMHPAALFALAAFVGFLTRFQIIPEERALADNFGAAYADYAARVRRWL